MMLVKCRKASRNFSLTTLPAPAASAALAAACSWPTLASEAPQDLQVTIEEFVAFSGAPKLAAPQAAQASMFGGFISTPSPGMHREIVALARTSPTRHSFCTASLAEAVAEMIQ